ncbi:pleiotropic drug resistance ABC transporter [Macrolepiota fuliginosa MF-IS2]|uniref:Pleiotropic drug resistance ABC transporter n=1 Tax=Macrolepiota fuliginosa MF-IS2 TaxID=1400762 RepID=A0A9P6C2N5_9AGAR|nr:pleiotropic drug resistance ABC transporter [Macrolepiota fuliginosa MF-IS2]
MAEHHHQLSDIQEETPPNTLSRPTSQPTLLNIDVGQSAEIPNERHVPPPLSPSSHHTRPRRGSSVSHVDVAFFDPEGVQELTRSLTRRSTKEPKNQDIESLSTDSTIAPKDGEPFDLAKTLRRIVQKREEHQIKPRELGVVFKNLRVVGLGATASYAPTMGSLLNPSSIFEAFQKVRHPPARDILSGFEGVVKPGEMILVLGRPGSGCSTLLKTIANRRKEYYAVEGDVHYDSFSPSELYNHYRGDVQYCPEDDIHFPTLTVEQTLQFAATARTPRHRAIDSRNEFADKLTDILTTVFGLRHARKTPVGDHMLRGVSGGEKKRVSIAEALAARSCIGAWDNSTRGLDASTALEFVQALRVATDTFRLTTIVSIYQAGESLYKHFDKVCVIYEGKMAYFGPADRARQYFIDLGYQPANRQTTADFLVAATDPNGRIARPGFHPPQTATEFADQFKNSELGKLNRQEIDEYTLEFVGKPDRADAYKQSARRELAKGSRKKSPYLLSIPQQIQAVMRRRVQILRGNMLLTGLNLFSFVFQALIMGSLFLRMKENTSAFFSRGGVLFFALLFSALAAMAEIPALYGQRPIVLRHEHGALYHPFIEALALTLVDIPITLVTLIIFSIILYFMVGLQQSADQFFVFLLFLFAMSITMKGWFRAIAAAFASDAVALSFAGISVLAVAIYTGYTIPKPTMIGALRWITYINPLRYGFEALMTNEFRTLQGECSSLVPQGPGYENITIANQVCTTVGSLLGQPVVDGSRFLELSYGFQWSNTWKNLGIVIAYGIGFFAALLIFTEFNTSTFHESAVVLFRRGHKKLSGATDEEAGTVHEKEPLPESDKEAGNKAMASHEPMTDIFSWQHLQYTVPIPGAADRKLLDDVSGFVAPGKLTALMGESGAGKTTLLNVLAQRTSTGVVAGDRFVNGQVLPHDFQAQTGYCQQMDTHTPESTVREALLFSAKLRQPASVPLAEKEAYVEKCLRMCGLEDYAEATIGSLSIEHRKRTTIGVELAAKPKLLLFLDEPTSGLDSQSAWAIVSFLRSLADNGQAILCTIHQPSAELFQVFDRLLLLKKGGKTVYFGDLGVNADTLIHYFENNGGRKCQAEENPAEYMLEVIGAGATATSEQDWYTIWKNSPEAVRLEEQIHDIHTEGRKKPAVEAAFASEFATSWFYQVWELLKRDHVAYWRNPTYLMAKLALNIIGGLFIGFTFFQSSNSQQGTQNKLFSIFMVTILSVPLSSQLQVPYIDKRTVYEVRERPSRIYSWTAFVTSHLLVEIPWNVIGSHFLFFCWYWTVGYPTDRAGYTYLMLTIIYPLYYSTISLAIAATAPNAEIAGLLFSTLFSFVIAFNGVMQPFRELHWWKWMYRLSPYTYLIEGLLGQALGRQSIECSAIEFVQLNPPSGMTCAQYLNPFISAAGGYLTNPDATTTCNFCSMSTADQFLASGFNIFYDHAWRNFGFMIVYIVFNIVVFFGFTYIFRIHTGSFLPKFNKTKKSQA